MTDSVAGLSAQQIIEIFGVIVPIGGAVAFVLKTINSVVKAAVEEEAKNRHTLAKTFQTTVGLLDARTTTLERDGATRKDLDAAEARIKTDFSEVKKDVREMRLSSQTILQQVAGLAALVEARLIGGKRAAIVSPAVEND